MDSTPLDLSSMDFHPHRTHRECFKTSRDSRGILRLSTLPSTSCCYKIWSRTIHRSQLMDIRCRANRILSFKTTCSLILSCTTLTVLVGVLLDSDIIKQRRTLGVSQIFQRSRGMVLPAQSWSVIQQPQTWTIWWLKTSSKSARQWVGILPPSFATREWSLVELIWTTWAPLSQQQVLPLMTLTSSTLTNKCTNPSWEAL